METELWFNKVGNTGIPVAPRRNTMVIDADRNISTTNEESPVSPRTESITCNRCDGGGEIQNRFSVKWRADGQYVCPDNWTMDKDPCGDKIPMGNGSNTGMNTGSSSVGNGVPTPTNEMMSYLPYVGIALVGYLLLK